MLNWRIVLVNHRDKTTGSHVLGKGRRHVLGVIYSSMFWESTTGGFVLIFVLLFIEEMY